MIIKELIKELSDYPQDTRIDFILLDKEDWLDNTRDTYLSVKGIVGSGDDVEKYIELGLENKNEKR